MFLAPIGLASDIEFTRHDIKVGTAPAHIAVFDVNIDGHADMVVTDQVEDRLHLLLGKGRGEFRESAASPFAAGSSPGEVVVDDFNRDSYADCAIANHNVDYVTILLGDSAGTFNPSPGSPLKVVSDPHPHTIRAADVNSDTLVDLILDSTNDHALIILYGDGTGRFTAADSLVSAGGRLYHTIACGDINHDGFTDVITPNRDDISVLLGSGKGTFALARGSPFPAVDPFSVAVGDVNGDGHPDIASGGGEREASISVLIGNGKGGFSPADGSPFTGGRGAGTVALGDINGDGFDDICATHYQSNSVTVVLGGREELIPAAKSPMTVDEAPYGIAVSDLNKDRRAEIIVGHYETGMVTIFSAER